MLNRALIYNASFQGLYGVTTHLSDKDEISALLAKIEKEMKEIDATERPYSPVTLQQLIAQIPDQPGFYFAIRKRLNKMIEPLTLNVEKPKQPIQQAAPQKTLSASDQILRTKSLYAQQALIEHDEHQRTVLESTLKAIEQIKPEVGMRCFISYPQSEQSFAEEETWLKYFLCLLHRHLKMAGIEPVLDIIDKNHSRPVIFANNIKTSEFALLFCTNSLPHAANIQHDFGSQLVLLQQKYDYDIASYGKSRVLSVLLTGNQRTATLPEYGMCQALIDWRDQSYVKNLQQLITKIYAPKSSSPAFQSIWKDFFDKNNELTDCMPHARANEVITSLWYKSILMIGSQQVLSSTPSATVPVIQSSLVVTENKDDVRHLFLGQRPPQTAISMKTEVPAEVSIGKIKVGTLQYFSENSVKQGIEIKQSRSSGLSSSQTSSMTSISSERTLKHPLFTPPEVKKENKSTLNIIDEGGSFLTIKVPLKNKDDAILIIDKTFAKKDDIKITHQINNFYTSVEIECNALQLYQSITQPGTYHLNASNFNSIWKTDAELQLSLTPSSSPTISAPSSAVTMSQASSTSSGTSSLYSSFSSAVFKAKESKSESIPKTDPTVDELNKVFGISGLVTKVEKGSYFLFISFNSKVDRALYEKIINEKLLAGISHPHINKLKERSTLQIPTDDPKIYEQFIQNVAKVLREVSAPGLTFG